MTSGDVNSASGPTSTGIQMSQTANRCHRRSGTPVGKVANRLMKPAVATASAVNPIVLNSGNHGSEIHSTLR